MENSFEIESDLDYLIKRKKDLIERLNGLLELGEVDEVEEDRCRSFVSSIFRLNKQIKLSEDALIIYKLNKN